jgi:predicted ATPase
VLNGIRLAVHADILEPQKVQLHFFQPSKKPEDISKQVVSPKIDRNGRLDRWPEGFFDEWDKSLEVLLTPGTTA